MCSTFLDFRSSAFAAIVGIISFVNVDISLSTSPTFARPLSLTEPLDIPDSIVEQGNAQSTNVAPRSTADEIPAELRRQMVRYETREAPGTIVIDTSNTYLYYVLGSGRAIRYGVGVGRDGFTWSGVRAINRKVEWPDWIPPSEMIDRQPDLPRWMAGGPSNPLGARAMYLGGTLYRIHGTSEPETIGQHVSSGCIRMLNEDVVDLFNRVSIGTKVVVLPDTSQRASFYTLRESESSRRQPSWNASVFEGPPSRTAPIMSVYSASSLY